MHPLTFEVKRAHWAATWFAIHEFWRKAEETGITELGLMTPARFDILFLIHLRAKEVPEQGHRMHQAAITRELRLDRTTVWKTLRRMEQLGLVTRTTARGCSRRQVITITEMGMTAFKAALHVVFTDHRLRSHLEAFVDRYLVDHRAARGRKTRFRRRPILDWMLSLVDGARGAVAHFDRAASVIYCVNSLLEL